MIPGMRNLVGTGLVELAGGLLTASLAFMVMLRLSPRVTLLTVVALGAFGLVVFQAFRVLRPIFRERGQMYAEVTGPPESLGSPVVKGYHAERAGGRLEGGSGASSTTCSGPWRRLPSCPSRPRCSSGSWARA
jgi:subfamily B ATP-binding cassette protein MsbA